MTFNLLEWLMKQCSNCMWQSAHTDIQLHRVSFGKDFPFCFKDTSICSFCALLASLVFPHNHPLTPGCGHSIPTSSPGPPKAWPRLGARCRPSLWPLRLHCWLLSLGISPHLSPSPWVPKIPEKLSLHPSSLGIQVHTMSSSISHQLMALKSLSKDTSALSFIHIYPTAGFSPLGCSVVPQTQLLFISKMKLHLHCVSIPTWPTPGLTISVSGTTNS